MDKKGSASWLSVAVGAMALSVLIAPTLGVAQSTGEPGRGSEEFNPLKNVYFGEQHLHTTNSPDAFSFGTRNTPDDAYRFCKGEAIKKSTTGEMIQKATPYDWCAVTDHAECLGMMPLLLDPESTLRDTPIAKLLAEGKGEEAFRQIITSATVGEIIPYLADPAVQATAWQGQVEAANRQTQRAGQVHSLDRL